MPVIIRGEAAKANDVAGCVVAALLRRDDIGNDQIELDHVTMAIGATHELELDGSAIGWLQVLSGSGTLGDNTLTTSHIAYLPLGFSRGFYAVRRRHPNSGVDGARCGTFRRRDRGHAYHPELRQLDPRAGASVRT